MPKSMTGYGQAKGRHAGRGFSVEVKSVNHKYCEVNLRISSNYSLLEPKIVEFAKSYFQRGRIDVFVRDEHQNPAASPLKIDQVKLKSFHRELIRSAKALGISTDIDLKTLLGFPQMYLADEEEDIEKYWVQLKRLLKKAFEAMEKMRQNEGGGVEKFLKQQLMFLDREVQKIKKMVPKTVAGHQALLEERIKKLSQNIELDPVRLAQEIAYFVDRTDISEELQRLEHHCQHFGELLKAKGPLGRKLDFLLQEMNREVNTLSAKVQNALISRRVVECKHALEKMREQVQNIE